MSNKTIPCTASLSNRRISSSNVLVRLAGLENKSTSNQTVPRPHGFCQNLTCCGAPLWFGCMVCIGCITGCCITGCCMDCWLCWRCWAHCCWFHCACSCCCCSFCCSACHCICCCICICACICCCCNCCCCNCCCCHCCHCCCCCCCCCCCLGFKPPQCELSNSLPIKFQVSGCIAAWQKDSNKACRCHIELNTFVAESRMLYWSWNVFQARDRQIHRTNKNSAEPLIEHLFLESRVMCSHYPKERKIVYCVQKDMWMEKFIGAHKRIYHSNVFLYSRNGLSRMKSVLGCFKSVSRTAWGFHSPRLKLARLQIS